MTRMSAADRVAYVEYASKAADPTWPVQAVDDFREGWAVIPFIHRPHFWRREGEERLYVASCGVRNDLRGAHRGVHPLTTDGRHGDTCQNCMRAVRRS